MIWLLGSLAVAGPWTKPSGSHYVKVGGDWYRTTRYVLPDEGSGLGSTGDFATEGFFGHQYSVYGEIGISKTIPVQIAARIPLTYSVVQFSAEDTNRAVSGTAHTVRWGDLEVTPQVALSKKKPIAVGVTFKLPMYRVNQICDDSVWKDFCGRPGDGQTDITPYFTAGGGLFGGKGWVEALVGWRFRTELFYDWDTERTLRDGAVFGGVLGFKAGPFLPMLRVDGILTVPEYIGLATKKGYQRDGYTAERITIGPSFLFDIAEGVALEGRGGYELYARNTSIGLSFGAGISWRVP